MAKFKKQQIVIILEVHQGYHQYENLVGALAVVKDSDNAKFGCWVDVPGIEANRTTDGGFCWVKAVPATPLMKELV